MLIDRMDELLNLFITLDRQITRENYKQAFVIARTIHMKLSALMDDLQLEMIKNDELEPVR